MLLHSKVFFVFFFLIKSLLAQTASVANGLMRYAHKQTDPDILTQLHFTPLNPHNQTQVVHYNLPTSFHQD